MVPWLKPTSASADGGRLRRAKFGVEKGVERGRRRVDANPAFVRIAEGERKPFAPDRRLAARVRRVRRHEGGVRQQALPGPADIDQVVAVGAIAVQEHDQLLGGAGSRLQTWAVEVSHYRFFLLVSFFFAADFFFLADDFVFVIRGPGFLAFV